MEFLELDGGVVGTAAAAARREGEGGEETREVSFLDSLDDGLEVGFINGGAVR